MTPQRSQPVILQAVVDEMRQIARSGATLGPLVAVVRTGAGYQNQATLPILWYFVHAFSLPLPVVLPLREWLTEEGDPLVEGQLLSAINQARPSWDR